MNIMKKNVKGLERKNEDAQSQINKAKGEKRKKYKEE